MARELNDQRNVIRRFTVLDPVGRARAQSAHEDAIEVELRVDAEGSGDLLARNPPLRPAGEVDAHLVETETDGELADGFLPRGVPGVEVAGDEQRTVDLLHGAGEVCELTT